MPIQIGNKLIDGVLDDWVETERLYTSDFGDSIYADVTTSGIFLALKAPAIGAGTTIWLDTDMDRATGYQIWGWTGGIEYRVEIDASGSARLYDAVSNADLGAIDAVRSADETVIELHITSDQVVIGDQVRLFADVNDTIFLPGDYSQDVIAGDLPTYERTPDLRVGIVYSETTAQNWFDMTAYGQLVMTAQSQAMQAGLPFGLLGEADLTDGAALAQYDVLVFPGFSHVQGSQLKDITRALEIAQASGVSFVTAGNFLQTTRQALQLRVIHM